MRGGVVRRNSSCVRHMLRVSSRGVRRDCDSILNNNNNNHNKNVVDTDKNPSISISNSSSTFGSVDYFCKDGRKIGVGDCALFKPDEDSPPFIGIIRRLSAGKENKLKLGVNWLYRPAEVKLNKGSALEAAPNEIFYSFHSDEIPAASLLHPCKVAFLPRGVELPSGICSFVCRRVYDIKNKCLWWLSDKDFINERQEEVDQLLKKTRKEMHAAMQTGGRSPKTMNSPTSSQLKAGSDSVQNSASSFGSQSKGKKRERGDQGSEPSKRERFSKTDDNESGSYRQENSLRSEIAKITDKGGLIDSEGVEKLIKLMAPDKNDRRIDLVCRSMLAGVIASTEKFECLSRFVQLRGVPVLDEWLQEVHKGKIGDALGTKDGDKPVEEFLLVLLRALDKLPVDLQALQMCNIGKSVNHLRSHKNAEIQKKARSLVDTWKKRVEAEMNINDAKSGSNQAVSWATRSRPTDASHGGNRHSSGSSDVAVRGSGAQFQSSKTASAKPLQTDAATKSASVSPGSMKSSQSPASTSSSLKDGQFRNAAVGGSSDPAVAARDDKSSSSSQSQNHSHSCSSDHAKVGGISTKEDARSSTAGSVSANKVSGSSSRHRKSVNGFPGSGVSGVQRETGSTRSSSLHRSSASEKVILSSLSNEKAVDVPAVEGSSHKLIVKIPNRGRSPAQSASGGSLDEPPIMNSQASSPVLSEKHDRSSKEKFEAAKANVSSDMNMEACQGNDIAAAGSDEAAPDEERSKVGDGGKKVTEKSKTAFFSSETEQKSGRRHDLSSINVLIESCEKYSEANTSVSVADDGGMDLLASVAAGEISPMDSPERNTPVIQQASMASDSKVKASGDDPARDQIQSSAFVDEHEKLADRTTSIDMQQSAEPCTDGNGKSDETVGGDSLSPVNAKEKAADYEDGGRLMEKTACEGNAESKPKLSESSTLVKANDAMSGIEVETVDVKGILKPLSEIESKKNVNEAVNSALEREQKSPAIKSHSEVGKGCAKEVIRPSGSGKDMVADNINELKTEEVADALDESNQAKKQITETGSNAMMTSESQVGSIGVGTAATGQKVDVKAGDSESKDGNELLPGKLASNKAHSSVVQETEQHVRAKDSKLSGTDADDVEECTSTTADASSRPATSGSDTDAKAVFDLNEGLNAEDGRYAEQNNSTTTCCAAPVPLISPLPFPMSSVTTSLPASITVAAAAKGPFVPPDDLLRNRGELGWKGSAATSAFRPAEPRKVSEVPVGSNNSPVPDAVSSKASRPTLDFDLNVPDERILEDMASRSSVKDMGPASEPANRDSSTSLRCSGGLDLDLNQVVETIDASNYSENSARRADVPFLPVKSSSGGLPNGDGTVRRDFDLNDGPSVDEPAAEPSPFSQQTRGAVPLHPSVPSIRMNNSEMGNFSSWYSPSATYSAVSLPSVLPDRGGEQPFPIVATAGPPRMLVPPTGGNPFNTDLYRGPVLSSSPAVPFASTPFQYPVFPFGNSFSLPSATFSGGSTAYADSSSGGRLCFSAVPSQLLGPAAAVTSPFSRPYVVGLPDSSSNSGADSSRKWGRQGLDLNAGPGGPDVEGRDETTSPLMARQQSVASSQALAEEQIRMYQVPGGSVKRKEPEGGWDNYKPFPWQ